MTQSDAPWAGLGRGGIDSRRVNHAGKWNFFWAIMQKDDPALALVLETMPSQVPNLPRLRSLEGGFATLNGGPTFYLRLRDHAQMELFETLCRDVVSCAEKGDSEGEALARAIGRTCRWHHLLRGGKGDALSAEEQKGLIGELTVLGRLCATLPLRAAINAWKGPMGAPKDFEMHGHCIEVKSRRAAAQPFVQISNEFQLSDVENHRLWLCVLAVDRVSAPFGNSLDFHVAEVGAFFQDDPACAIEWEQALNAAGYRQEDDYSDFRWVVSAPSWHEVLDGFPRVEARLPQGVTDVKYAIALSACEPFAVETASVEHALAEGYTDV